MTWTVANAIEASCSWLLDHANEVPGYGGAYIAGSVARLADTATVPPGSDIDIMVLGHESRALGKHVTAGLVIEGTVIEAATARDPDAVLGDYHLAPGIARARILDDPRGHIVRVQEEVRSRYADPDTVAARLDHVEKQIRATLASVTNDRSEAERITAWQFGVGQMAHLILVAGLENPTVRRRYIAAAEVLARFDEEIAYERLLRLARINRVRRPAVEALSRDLGALLERTGPVADRSTWRFASDVSTSMRPVIMDGVQETIREGWHREAMFWIIATWCRCAQVLEDEELQVYGGLFGLRKALNVASDDDLREAVAEAMDAIPAFRALANRIADEGIGPQAV